MDLPVLTDPKQVPTDEILAALLGRSFAVYRNMLGDDAAKFPGVVHQWKFYRDGNRWLMNAAWKKKTLYWLGPKKGSYRVTFYLNDRAAEDVAHAAIPADVKKGFKETAGKKFRGATLPMKTTKDLASFKELREIKLRFLK